MSTMRTLAVATVFLLACAIAAQGGTLQVPATVSAGSGLTIPTSGSGTATLYVVGPGTAIKKKVQLGQDVQLTADDLKNAGRYLISLDGGDSATLYVMAGPVSSIAFLARPSRVPAATPNVISSTAFVFDKFQNLVMQPQPVKFELSAEGATVSRTESTRYGVAYTKLDSSKKGRRGAVRRVQRFGLGSTGSAGGGVRSLQHSHACGARQNRHPGAD
jgi:hypothetical protein